MDDRYIDDLLFRMVNIPSVFPHEKDVLLFIEKECLALGCEIQRYPVTEARWNVRARIGSGSPVVCLNAHADTMPINGESLPVARVEKGIMYGLGTADTKGAITAMMAVIKSIRDSGKAIHGTLDVLVSVDEEADGLGVRAAVDQGYRCDMAIVGEPSSLQIMPVHTGLVFLEVTTFGTSAHGAIPWAGNNAIERMMELVADLKQVVMDGSSHPLAGTPSLNLGRIQAGDRPNRVPNRCEASVDIRFVAPMKVEEMLSKIETFFAARKGSAEYRVTKCGGTLDTAMSSRLASAMIDGVTQVLGIKPGQPAAMRGWTEADIFQSRLGIDAVVFGPGGLGQAHSANEFVNMQEVYQAARIYEATVRALLA